MRLGIIRLEKIFQFKDKFFSKSSIIMWYKALQLKTESIAIVAPVKKIDNSISDRYLKLRPTDRMLSLPDVKGYIRVFLFSPLIILNLIKLKICKYNHIICRIPEHGNLIILPLLKILKFNIIIWVVANRKVLEETLKKERRKSLKLTIGLMISKLIGEIEKNFLKKYPSIVNGIELYRWVKELKGTGDEILKIISTSFSVQDLPSYEKKTIREKKEFLLLYVGRIAPEKGLKDLIEAAYLLTREKYKIKVIIIGWESHGEIEKLKSQIRKRKISKIVSIKGAVPYGEKLFQYFQKADIFILPSYSEGTPRVLIDAMAFGLPVVATKVGGVEEIIEDMQNGFLVSPHSPAEIVLAVKKLINLPFLYERISFNNIQKAKKNSIEKLTEKMLLFIKKKSLEKQK